MARSQISGHTAARRWTFRLLTVILAPLLAIAVLELGLRGAGVGYPSAFTLACRINGVASRCDNPRFSWRFFPRRVARPAQSFAFAVDKPARTVRIFVVGGSAAQGDPDPTYGIGRMLQAQLEARYPGIRFEVVNAAITAVNSHVVLPVVRDLRRYDADVFVVYLGNNEVVGPFGAGSIFSPGEGRHWLTRAGLFARSLRLGQLIAGSSLAGGRSPDAWHGMEMFLEHRVAADDPRLQGVYDGFRKNLEKIVATALRTGGGVILTTVPTNVADCAPFASLHRQDLTAEESDRWQRLVAEASRLEADGRLDAALDRLLEAERIDGAFAELHYRLGRLQRALSRPDQARSRFERARDLDALRFRADSRINEIIRTVGAGRSDSRLRLIDGERFVAVKGADAELFHEHVHLSFAGNHLLAGALLEETETLLPAWVEEHRVEGPALTLEQCAARLAHSDFDRQRIAAELRQRLARPPFTNQLDHAERLAQLDERLGRLSRPPESARRSVARQYADALRRAPADPWLHYNHAALLSTMGDPVGAGEALRVFLGLLPHDIGGREKLCAALAEQGRFEEALAECRALRETMPHFAKPYYTMAYALARMGRLEESIDVYESLLAVDPGSSSEIYNEIGRIQLHAGRPELALETYRRAIDDAASRARGPVPDLHYNRAFALKRSGRAEEARAAFRRAAELYAKVWTASPRSVAPLLAAGNALVECGDLEGAASRFREAATHDPSEAAGHFGLVRTLERAGRQDEALAAARAGVAALEATGRSEAAAALRDRVAAARPGAGGGS